MIVLMVFEFYVAGQFGRSDGNAQMFELIINEKVNDSSGDCEFHIIKTFGQKIN